MSTSTPLPADNPMAGMSTDESHPIPAKRHPPKKYAPRPAYIAKPNSPLYGDRDLYVRIARTGGVSGARVQTNSHTVPPRSGIAFSVPAGHIVRITTPSGPQVGDLNVWNLHNPRERFWAARTRQLHASHVRVFDRLWSCLPYLRPMATVTNDSLAGYGIDECGGRCHDLLGTRCDPYVRKMLTKSADGVEEGEEFDFHCHSNLTRAILRWGLAEYDVHDVLNVFQVTGLDHDGRYFMAPCPATGGSQSFPGQERAAVANPGGIPDFFEFFAEIDLLCALSACPGGDLSNWEWSNETAMRQTCRELGVEIYSLAEDVRASVLGDWTSPSTSDYRGAHGLTIPRGEEIG